MILFLIGFMGSGKSYYAKAISTYLNVSCFDLDTEIESSEGKKINQIFAENGEAYFRRIESDILKKTVAKLTSNQGLNEVGNHEMLGVIACGGGTPCFQGNMEWMNQHGFTIWIDPPLHILAERLEKEKDHRPLIKDYSNSEMLAFIQQKLNERKTFYSQAHLIIQDSHIETTEILKRINHA